MLKVYFVAAFQSVGEVSRKEWGDEIPPTFRHKLPLVSNSVDWHLRQISGDGDSQRAH